MRRRSRGRPPVAARWGLCRHLSQWRSGPVGPVMLLGQGAQEERWEAPTSEKARGNKHTVEVSPPPEMDEVMARHLQWEEQEEEQARRGQDAATLVVVREAAGPLMWGQVEGLEGPS